MAAVRQDIRAFIERELSPAARSAKLAALAQKGVAELIRSGRASPDFVRYVDGRKGAPEAAVRGSAGGVILYEFAYIGRAVGTAVAELQKRSPARSGRYRKSFMVAVNGRPVRAESLDPTKIPPDAEVFIYNTQPYSRKVDVQLNGTRPLRFSVPPGLFDDVAKVVRRQFGNTVSCKRLSNIKFTGQARTRAGRTVDSPALVLSVLV